MSRFAVSKYRHISPKEWNRDQWYPDINPSTFGDSTNVAASAMYYAVNWAGNAGSVGLLDMMKPGKRKEEVPRIHAHSSPINDMTFAPHNDYLLATAGDDCYAKCWKLPAEIKPGQSISDPHAKLQGHRGKVTSVRFHPTCTGVLASSSLDKTVQIWDIEHNGGESKNKMEIFDDAVTSVAWNYDGSLLAAVSKDKKLRIMDPRLGNTDSSVKETDAHKGVKPMKCMFMGKEARVLTTGFSQSRDRQFGLWDLRALEKPQRMVTIDQSPGILSPYFDIDSGLFFLNGKGDSTIWLYESVATAPYFNELTHYVSSTPFKGLAMTPKRVVNVFSCEICRMIKLSQNSLIPIGFYVPRKCKREFDEIKDLYPDTIGPSSGTAEEYFANKNPQPKLMSMEPSSSNTSYSEPEPEPAVSKMPSTMHAAARVQSKKTEQTDNNSSQQKSPVLRKGRQASVSETSQRISQKLVRYTKFRHVKAQPMKKATFYEGLRINANALTLIRANSKHYAVPWEGAGGRLVVRPISEHGRVPSELSWFEHGADLVDYNFNPFDESIIVSGGEDAHAKVWKIPHGGLTETFTEPEMDLKGHQRRVTTIDFHPVADNLLFTSAGDGDVRIWDLNRSDCTSVLTLGGHEDVTMNLSFNWDGSFFATSCKDRIMRLFDPRTQAIAQQVQAHEGVKGFKLEITGQKGKILTVGFARSSERQVAIWDIKKLDKPLHVKAIDHLSGIITPYYDPDTSVVLLAGRGDGNIKLFEVVDEAPFLHFLTEYGSSIPQTDIAVLPKKMCNVKMCEIFRVFKLSGSPPTTVEPIQFMVPRNRMEYFQDDIFPPTRSLKPTLSASEWLDGKNKDPELVSIQPADLKRLSTAPALEKVTPKYGPTDPDALKKDWTPDDVFNEFYTRMQDYKEDEKTTDHVPEASLDNPEDKQGWGVDEEEWSD